MQTKSRLFIQKILAGIILLLLISTAAFAEEGFFFRPSPRIFGLDFTAGIAGDFFIPGITTRGTLTVGGGYEEKSYFRLPDGSIVTGTENGLVAPEQDPYFQRVNFQWEPLLIQELFSGPDADSLPAFALAYRGRIDWYQEDPAVHELLFRSTRPDREGIFQNSLFTAFLWDTITQDEKHLVKSGFHGELSAEWGPAFLGNTIFGSADFYRFNTTWYGFLPLFIMPHENPGNLLSFYGGGFISADYIGGPVLPLNVLQTLGGFSPRLGLGKAVRGVDKAQYDTRLKVVANLELRCTLPALWLPEIVPGLVTYFDSGYYNMLEGGPAEGFIFSTGAGGYLTVQGLFTIAGYTHYYINGARVNGNSWTPFQIAFGLHF